jgi:predicted restriction endonuclease
MATLWEKLQFWKKQKLKYKFQYREGDSTWVEITSGTYAGVIYSYGTVKFVPESGVAKLQFNYNILHSGEHDLEGLQNDAEFVNVMGDILTEIIIENEPIRTNNTEEPDLQ